MAEGTRSKAESAKSIKIRELNELADQIGIRPEDRPTFILAKFEEWEKVEREKEKEAHAFRMKEKEIELEKLKANDESRTTNAADQNSPNCQTPHFNLEPFDETKESIETFLERFQNVATNNQLPIGKWSFRVSQALRGKAYEVYAKLPSSSQNDYSALKNALLVQFDLTANSYHKKFRNSRLERREVYSSLFARLEKYLDKWLSLSPFTQNYEGLKDLILVEQLRECMAPDLRIFIDESGVTTPQEIVSYSDRFLAAHREQKTKTSDQSPSIAKVDKQPDPSTSSNNNNNKQTRQPNNQAPRLPIPPNPPRQQKKWCSFHNSPTHDSSECHNRSRPYSAQPLMVITQATPILNPSPSNHPPTVEKVLVNGISSNCLYDSGCSFSAIVRKSLVKPRYISNKWVTIQGADLNSPPFTLPIARIKVRSRYVNGRIEAAVMDNPCFDLTLGDKYVFLGTPTDPRFTTPGVIPVNPNATNPSVPETDHISAFPVITGAQAPQDGARETLNSLRRGYKESPRSYLSSAKILVPVKRDKSKIHWRPIARKPGLPQHHSGGEGGARSHAAQSQRFGPQTQQIGQPNSQNSKQSRGVKAENPISSSITKNADSSGTTVVMQAANLNALAIERSTHSASAPINAQGTGTAAIVLLQDSGIDSVMDIASSATMVAPDIVRGIKPLGAALDSRSTESHPGPLNTRSACTNSCETRQCLPLETPGKVSLFPTLHISAPLLNAEGLKPHPPLSHIDELPSNPAEVILSESDPPPSRLSNLQVSSANKREDCKICLKFLCVVVLWMFLAHHYGSNPKASQGPSHDGSTLHVPPRLVLVATLMLIAFLLGYLSARISWPHFCSRRKVFLTTPKFSKGLQQFQHNENKPNAQSRLLLFSHSPARNGSHKEGVTPAFLDWCTIASANKSALDPVVEFVIHHSVPAHAGPDDVISECTLLRRGPACPSII
ncbi:uncharacterized protein LOC129927634 [Biomphalaria glabrata]|uniref:Uncharacterized protein LOC129927634 n=1 Tax=Biomphalaria glabrata TaxID=6526 RepID=A0A9W3B1N3_BIOGL|nr:uncharacterized protein LOC129927634 [Biomphalaria glabrata]